VSAGRLIKQKHLPDSKDLEILQTKRDNEWEVFDSAWAEDPTEFCRGVLDVFHALLTKEADKEGNPNRNAFPIHERRQLRDTLE